MKVGGEDDDCYRQDRSSTSMKIKHKKKEGRRDSADGDDSCTTDDQRKEPTYLLLQSNLYNV